MSTMKLAETGLQQQVYKSALTPEPRLSFRGVVRSEWIKAMSLRSVRWSIGLSVILGIGLSLIMALAERSMMTGEGTDHSTYLLTITAFPANFLALVFGVLGVFVFSSEYSSGMILSTLTAVPRRGLALAGKAVVLTAISLVVAVVTIAGGVVAGIVIIPAASGSLATAATMSGLAGTVFFLVVVSLFAFAVAGIVRSNAGAITIVLGIVFVAPMILQIIGQITDWSWVSVVTNYLITTLGNTAGMGSKWATAGGTAAVHAPGYWESLGALALWVALPMIGTIRTFLSRDAR